MQEVVGYKINVNDLFNSPPKTEDVHNNNKNISSVDYDNPAPEGNDQEGIYEYIEEFSKPISFFKKYYRRLLVLILILVLIGIGITLLVVLLHHGSSEVTATTPKILPDSITSTKSPIAATSPPDDTSCISTNYPSTFLFAYSNDLSSDTVLDSWNNFSFYHTYYSWFGSVRIDTENINIQFHKIKEGVNSTIKNNLLDPNQRFQNSSIGSNVLDVIKKFFSNTEAPVCGSRIVVLLKRYPNEADNSRLASLIRSHHAIVYVVTSATPSGGSQPKTMFSVASKTNGMGSVEYDKNFCQIIYYYPLYDNPYPVYATTIQVSGSGTKALPDLNLPTPSDYLIEITFQDHVPDDSFRNLNLRWTNSVDSGNYRNDSSDVTNNWFGGTYTGDWRGFHGVNYSISLDYVYLGQNVQNLQIRLYSVIALRNWLPYSD